ncbi:hypothetical protein WJR50_31190 [Catalinimonas sp. 4WD22]|uniref:FAD-dependent oxidoreductase n=1 Tax=Catalinimonas locisalis TaxID=3133978 RepID=UPI0031016EA4
MKNRSQNKSAIVIGASMAGLVAARVLSDHFKKVYLIERDPIRDQAESRKGQPQTRHIHILLASGLDTLQNYFPDLLDSLSEGGAIVCDPAQNMVWNCYGDYRTQFKIGKQTVFASRPFLEWNIRQRVLKLKNVEMMSAYSVEQLLTDPARREVNGVQIMQLRDKKTSILMGDLIVDASGRGSRAEKWLEQTGYDAPSASKVSCKTGYTSRIYQRTAESTGALKWVAITPEAPQEQRGGGAFPVEGDRWIVSLFGWYDDHAPRDEAGFEAFAKSLPAPDLYNIVSQNEPISDFFTHKFPFSLRRHYEKLEHFPQGFLVLGDAVCSFNPIYGQGMTSSILQAAALDKLLREQKGKLKDIAKPYFRRVAKVIDIPWQIAVGEDFRYPQTTGKKPMATNFINAYLTHVHRATHTDPVVSKALIEVLNMLKPPTYLFRTQIVGRVLRCMLKRPAPRPVADHQLAKT